MKDNLSEIRKSIDKIDLEILRLLNQRMEFALKTRKFKSETSDQTREQEVLARIKRNAPATIKGEFSEKVFGDVIKESKRLQEQNLRLIGFQGEHGAYSEDAAKNYDKKFVPIPCSEFADVFEGVVEGQLDLGVVPVENSLAGSVDPVNDLLVDTNLKVIAELVMPIHHCLLTLPDTDYREIRVVLSHPQALAQCRNFISRNKLEGRPVYDTAGAAKMLSADMPKATAVIASKLAAELYGLEVVKENIEDLGTNATRFLVISKQKSDVAGDKCSIVFSTKHEAGALFKVLKLFADNGINLTRIESRPIANDPGDYAFLLDFQGSDKETKIAEVIEKVKDHTVKFNFLGCYKSAKL